MPEVTIGTPSISSQPYSFTKGLKKALISTVLPAIGAAVAGLVLDPEFAAAIAAKAGTLGLGAGAVTFVLFLLQNWAKNRGR